MLMFFHQFQAFSSFNWTFVIKLNSKTEFLQIFKLEKAQNFSSFRQKFLVELSSSSEAKLKKTWLKNYSKMSSYFKFYDFESSYALP